MGRVSARGEEIRKFILTHVGANRGAIARLTAEHFKITRQAVNRHLQSLVRDGSLGEKGQTRNRTYDLAPQLEWTRTYELAADPQEDIVWRDDVGPTLGHLPENVLDVWAYGFTEMFNNARDHSGGTRILVSIRKTAVATEMLVGDNGVGIFKKIQREMNLLDERHAIFELSKGKLTTDPDRHTGEGIFFTSRAFDRFNILSGGVFFSHEFDDEEDWLLERGGSPDDGTAVFMHLGNHTARTMKKVFDKFTSGEDPGFTKTVVPVRLAQYGNDKLISRSQAKRVMARVDLFKKVILNFEEVPTIGQAFADEIFRVFARDHPNIEIIAVDTNSEVRRMIIRAKTSMPPSASPSPAPPEDDLS